MDNDNAALAKIGDVGTEEIRAIRAGGPLSLIHISEPTRPRLISYAVFCLKKSRIIGHLETASGLNPSPNIIM